MLRWGILLLIVGVLSLVLPKLGYDLRIMRFFGSARLIVEVLFIAGGVVLVALSFSKRSTTDDTDSHG